MLILEWLSPVDEYEKFYINYKNYEDNNNKVIWIMI